MDPQMVWDAMDECELETQCSSQKRDDHDDMDDETSSQHGTRTSPARSFFGFRR